MESPIKPPFYEQRLSESEETLDIAIYALKTKAYKSAVNRAYYSAMYAAEATLAFLDLPIPKSHAKLFAAVEEHLTRPARLGQAAYKLRLAGNIRQDSDYSPFSTGRIDAENALDAAEEFNRAAKRHIHARQNVRGFER